MRIRIREHNNKSQLIREALISKGHNVSDENTIGDILLIDNDFPVTDARTIIDRHKQGGAKIAVYPHGGNPHLLYGSRFEPYELVDIYLTPSYGHSHVLRDCGVTQPIHNIGWCLSPVMNFTNTTGNRILFAPVHPDGNGHLPDRERLANKAIYEKIIRLRHRYITVRHIGSLVSNGIRQYPGIKFVEASPTGIYDDILKADLVIASGTFAFMAAAMGVPTIMFEQGLGSSEYSEPFPNDTVNRYFKYPLDAIETEIPMESKLIFACRDSPELRKWRQHFIGEAMRPSRLVDVLKKVIYG